MLFDATCWPCLNNNIISLFVDASGSVKIWHVPTMDCLSSTQEGGRQVLACAFNASASNYITAGSDMTINLYDASTRQKLFSLEPRSVGGAGLVIICDLVIQ
jgi:WD40 repeat protein